MEFINKHQDKEFYRINKNNENNNVKLFFYLLVLIINFKFINSNIYNLFISINI